MVVYLVWFESMVEPPYVYRDEVIAQQDVTRINGAALDWSRHDGRLVGFGQQLWFIVPREVRETMEEDQEP